MNHIKLKNILKEIVNEGELDPKWDQWAKNIKHGGPPGEKAPMDPKWEQWFQNLKKGDNSPLIHCPSWLKDKPPQVKLHFFKSLISFLKGKQN